MANTILTEFNKYFQDLAATNTVCVDFGATFISGTNLFIGIEPAKDSNLLVILPGAGSPPSSEGDRHNPDVVIKIKHTSVQSSLKTSQSIINLLHTNTNVCASKPGRVYALQSSPRITEFQEKGEYCITETNYSVKHIKL